MHISWNLCLFPLVSAQLYPRAASSTSNWTPSSTSQSTSSSKLSSSSTSTLSTITSSASLTSRTATGESCGICAFSADDHQEWAWPLPLWNNITVATIIYKINTILNVTQTITSLATIQPTGPSENDAEQWNSALSTTGVSMRDGTPVLTKTVTIYTKPDAFYTSAISLQYPTSYENWGWLYWTATSESQVYTSTISRTIESSGTDCKLGESTAFAVTPTAPLPGQSALYQGIVNLTKFLSMVPETVKDHCTIALIAPAGAVVMQTALTATSTEYDDNVHAQSTTTKVSAATNSKTTPKTTTTKASAAPAESPKASTKESPAVPAPSPSPTTATVTHISTIASTGTSTITPIVIASSTLTPGSTIIVSSTTYSLQITTSGSSTITNLIANGKTLTSTSTAGYGSLIYAGLGGTVTATAGNAITTTGTTVLGTSTSVQVETYLGGASKGDVRRAGLCGGIVLAAAVGMGML